MANAKLDRAPTYYRSPIGRGLSDRSYVMTDGGKFGAGVVTGIAVIKRGEALGHNAWVDVDFVSQVKAAMQLSGETGVKSRYTHPDMSGDGLAKGLGRVTFDESESPDVARGDLHFWKSSRVTPEGDLGGHVLQRAIEDPESFGASISFLRDAEAEMAFMLAHGARKTPSGLDLSGFKSPDPENVNNYPHVRLKKLRAVDIVDDPAANPDGLFCRDEVFEEAEALLAFALDETGSVNRPELVMLGVDGDRARGFVKRFLETRGLEVKPKDLGRLADGEVTPADKAELSEVQPETQVETPEATTEAPTAELASGDDRGEVKRFIDAFGLEGAQWYAEGLDWEQAQARFTRKLRDENEALKKRLELAAQSESTPLSQGGADPGAPKARSGFASKIKIRD